MHGNLFSGLTHEERRSQSGLLKTGPKIRKKKKERCGKGGTRREEKETSVWMVNKRVTQVLLKSIVGKKKRK
jgi:hypothetical protein